jgi:hypothetical protein
LGRGGRICAVDAILKKWVWWTFPYEFKKPPLFFANKSIKVWEGENKVQH